MNDKAAAMTIDPIMINLESKERAFDIDDPKLPNWIEDNVLSAGGFPYDKELKNKHYHKQLKAPDRTGEIADVADCERRTGDGPV